MRYIRQSDGSIVFRGIPPASFVPKNYAPVQGNPHQFKPVFAFECKYRIIKEKRSHCGSLHLGFDFICKLDGKGTCFSQCNTCDPETKLIQLDVKIGFGYTEQILKLCENNNGKETRPDTVDGASSISFNQTAGCERRDGACVLGETSTDLL